MRRVYRMALPSILNEPEAPRPPYFYGPVQPSHASWREAWQSPPRRLPGLDADAVSARPGRNPRARPLRQRLRQQTQQPVPISDPTRSSSARTAPPRSAARRHRRPHPMPIAVIVDNSQAAAPRHCRSARRADGVCRRHRRAWADRARHGRRSADDPVDYTTTSKSLLDAVGRLFSTCRAAARRCSTRIAEVANGLAQARIRSCGDRRH